MSENSNVAKIVAPIGCWTCKDRRVRCDLNLPGCLNCARVRRKCEGYGMRLSWPKASDSKRAMLGKLPSGRKNRSRLPQLYIIHTSFQDMKLHKYLADLSTRKMPNQLRGLPDLQFMSHDSSWKSYPLDGREADLIHYFASTAFSSLAIFNQDEAGFRDLLIQMALSNGSVHSRAVLFALLAVSLQYRDGLQFRAIQFKLAAISALAKSAEHGTLSTTEAAQHVAAGMLLCSFEIQTCSETNGQWLWYLRGVKNVIKANHLDGRTKESFIVDLLDWVYYHGVIAQFSILQWRHFPIEAIFDKQLGLESWDWMFGAQGLQVANRVRLSHRILQFLSEIFNVLFQAFEQRDTTENLVGNLKMLEIRANTIAKIVETCDKHSTEANTNDADMIKLYHSAAMVYLARVLESISGEPCNVQPILDEAFALLNRMRSCQLHFPLLILGHEARTDEQRIMVLDLFQRTENTYRRNLDCMKRSLKALWIQEDLVSDQDFVPKYEDKLVTITSQIKSIPSLV